MTCFFPECLLEEAARLMLWLACQMKIIRRTVKQHSDEDEGGKGGPSDSQNPDGGIKCSDVKQR